MKEIVLESAELRVVVLPAFGARVISLVDRRGGREWMAGGGISANTGEDAAYGAGEAVGWDECFPTVSRWDASRTAWGRELRDHGDLWGRAWTVDEHGPTSLHTSYSGAGFQFHRMLSLAGAELTASYRVSNTGAEPLPFIWALHALLATMPGDEIRLPGVERVAARYLGLGGRTLPEQEINWAGPNDVLPFPLDRVQAVEAAFAGKLYAGDVNRAAVGGPSGWLELAWEGVRDVGIWLTYGGWPRPGSDVHHVAIEPTTAAVDHLGQAVDSGAAAVLEAGASTSWRVTMKVRTANP